MATVEPRRRRMLAVRVLSGRVHRLSSPLRPAAAKIHTTGNVREADVGVRDFVGKKETPSCVSTGLVVRVGEDAGRAEPREARESDRDLVLLHARLGELASVDVTFSEVTEALEKLRDGPERHVALDAKQVLERRAVRHARRGLEHVPAVLRVKDGNAGSASQICESAPGLSAILLATKTHSRPGISCMRFCASS